MLLTWRRHLANNDDNNCFTVSNLNAMKFHFVFTAKNTWSYNIFGHGNGSPMATDVVLVLVVVGVVVIKFAIC